MKILYAENDIREYDEDKFYESLNRYGEVSRERIREEVNKLEWDPCHYSVLCELGVKLLPDENSARKYFEDHKLEGQVFNRLVRVCGYLTGDYRKANDGKLHEFAERRVSGVGHKEDKLAYEEIARQVNGQYTLDEKAQVELEKREQLNSMQDELHKGPCYD